MNSINFHSVKNIKVPEKLREKVLAIPDEPEHKPVGYRTRAVRIAAAAASIVLITAVSAALFLNIGGKSPIVVQPSPTDGATAATQPITEQPVSPSKSPILSTSDPEISPTVPVTDGTIAPARQSTVNNNQSTVSPLTENTTTAPDTAPTTAPIAPVTDPPTETPTEKQGSWNPQPPTALPWVPDDPTEVWLDPTEGIWTPPTRVSTTILHNQIPKDRRVYCRIESTAGEVFGGYELFADERLMTEIGSDRDCDIYVYEFAVYYNVPFRSETDVFNCIIYDSNGNVLTTNSVHWL